MGCEGRGFFSLFSGQPAQCGPLNNQIQQARANLDRTLGDLQRLQGNTADREGQRRALLVALGAERLRSAVSRLCQPGRRRLLREPVRARARIINPDAAARPRIGDTYRTLCVRTCDGYYFPISYSTVPGRFADDEKVCQRLCPATEVVLYSYRNPGEDVSQAVSTSGRTYSELPNAFSYRKAVQRRPAAASRRPDLGRRAQAARRPDRRARRHRRHRGARQAAVAAADRRAGQAAADRRQRQRGAPAQPPSARRPPAAAPPDDQTETEPGKRKVRTVGPTFLPAR